MFLPDQPLAGYKSERRFMRVMRSIPDIYRKLTTRLSPDGTMLRICEGNFVMRVIWKSTFLFLWTWSKTATQSRPVDLLSLDEVQENLACVNEGIALGLDCESGGFDTYMGIDRMGGYNAVIIKRLFGRTAGGGECRGDFRHVAVSPLRRTD